jgi:hypothetical protein
MQFRKLVYDTSSPDIAYNSNHTLATVEGCDLPNDVIHPSLGCTMRLDVDLTAKGYRKIYKYLTERSNVSWILLRPVTKM